MLDAPTPVLRVASVPGAHPYVAHLRLETADIEVLADPRPSGAPAGRWWPPVMLSGGWIVRHAESFDVLHVHFGVESLGIATLSRAIDDSERAGRPLVYTVHDLENPQLADQSLHQAQLDLLVTRASELITLTPGAATEIARRWGRTSTVIPHPRLLAHDANVPHGAAPARAGAPTRPNFTVGVHLRDLRPGIDGPGVAYGLAGAVTQLRRDGLNARGRIVMFEQVRDRAQADRVRAVVSGAPHVTVVQQPRASEAELVADLAGLDVSVLPYRYGTHSGWVELCWDLDLPVVGADIGYIAEQHEEPGWFTACEVTDPASLTQVLGGLAARAVRDSAGRTGREGTIAARRMRRNQLEPQLGAAHRQVLLRALLNR